MHVTRDPERKWAQYDRVSIGISIGNQNEQGDKLRAIVKWLNEQPNFKSCLICLSDTLYSWNQIDKAGVVLANANIIAAVKGDNWLSANREILADLQIPSELVRWDRWRRHPDFAITLKIFEHLYFTDPHFKSVIDAEIAEFADRRSKTHGPEAMENIRENSRRFILEELAGYTLFYRKYPHTAKIYPGRPTAAFSALHRKEVAGAPPGIDTEYFMEVFVEKVKAQLDLKRGDSTPKLKECAS